jgi:predicted acetyltransferase
VLLHKPELTRLPEYLDALRRGWTPDNDQDPIEATALIQRIEADPEKFMRAMSNPQGGGPLVQLTDGTLVPRLAYVRYWIWDGSYCGDVSLRWQPGTTDLPAYCDGHVGYAVVPWKRGRGLAAAALRELAHVARDHGLCWLDISMSSTNIASVRTAETAGAVFQGEFVAVEQGGVHARRYRLIVGDA